MNVSHPEKRIFFFGDANTEGSGKQKNLLGGKGANLAEMALIGLPVPPGFTLSTTVCGEFQNSNTLSKEIMEEVRRSIGRLEETTGKGFGNPEAPLLVSVRSGAPVSMPGMMDTVLNLGLNLEVRQGLEQLSGSGVFARDSHRRFIQMFGNVVSGIAGEHFHRELKAVKAFYNADLDTELNQEALDEVIERFLQVYEDKTGERFPEDPWIQLERAISAVFASWNNDRAIAYRRINRIADDLGTAVNVQSMVYGNLGNDCATGVGFTRNPATGEKRFYGEFLANAQGEDVVAGIRTPFPVLAERAATIKVPGCSLEETFPQAYQELMDVAQVLEKHYRDVQDLEFTIENNRLYLLQTRRAKRTGHAWLRTQVELVHEGIISKKTAVERVPAFSLAQVLAPSLDNADARVAETEGRKLAIGLNAGPGAATGRIAFNSDDAFKRADAGEKIILVREETTPEDISGMHAATGILTARGGLTSHAAVVARGMGKPCVVGCSALHVDAENETLSVGSKVFGRADTITINGSDGSVYLGDIKIVASEVLQVLNEKTLLARNAPTYRAFSELMGWADEFRKLGVRANADNAHDSDVALDLGAEGIGLCRTEHMFFETDRIAAVRQMILAHSVAERKAALAQIEPMQTADFHDIFKTMGSRPVTIRTLDPPLHEFLPHNAGEIRSLAAQMGLPASELNRRVNALRESNPMLGHRGCRLGMHYPEITAMQARAVLRAAVQVKADGIEVKPEIMIPLVGHVAELKDQRAVVLEAAEEVFEETGSSVEFIIGTMIEVPRAALTAEAIAKEAQFFSFGTNDLTQMTLGISRDDAGSFLPDYVRKGVYEVDPFVSLDIDGPGRLLRFAVNEGRKSRPDIKLGICGEHGGDPDTVHFCHEVGLDYVSCSPYRVPAARLAAAQAQLSEDSSI